MKPRILIITVIDENGVRLDRISVLVQDTDQFVHFRISDKNDERADEETLNFGKLTQFDL